MKQLHVASIILLGLITVLPAEASVFQDSTSILTYTETLQKSADAIHRDLGRFKKKPLFIASPERTYLELSFEELNSLITITELPAGVGSTITITDVPRLFSKIRGNAEHPFLRPSQDVIITKSASGSTLPYTINGALLPGYTLEEESFLYLFLRTIADPTLTALQIPATKTTPKVFIEDEQGKRTIDIVAEGVSDFSGSTNNRIHNIQTAMKKFNGFVIKQGSTFSFNDNVGPIDGSTGYKKELVIKGPRVEPDYGGGVCQVSSTIYRAALHAGFEIVDRKPHSFAVHYYEPWGTDATIYLGIQDLKFINDAPSDLIVHFFMDGKKLHANFYGKNDGRKVTMKGPNIYGHTGIPAATVEKVSYLPAGKRIVKEGGVAGFSAWWERIIEKPNTPVKKEIIDTTYPPKKGYVLEGAAAPAKATTEEPPTT